jgi:hypothetical protein
VPQPQRFNGPSKSIKFDGKGNWKAFKMKFERYAQLRQWTPVEARDNLCFCLDGKASEYLATILPREEYLEFQEIMRRLDKRFGFIETPETAQVRLQSLSQMPEESIEEWADRVLHLATHAFKNLPENHMTSQVIHKICNGCSDRDAGQHVVNLQLASIEDVIDKLKSYQFHHAAIYAHDKGHKPRVSEVVLNGNESEHEKEFDSFHVYRAREREQKYSKSSNNKNETNERLSDSNKTLNQRLSSLESGLGSLRGEILQAFKNLQRKTVARSRSPSNSPVRDSPSSPTRNQCFGCGGQGHFIADCPSKRTENRPARKVHFEEKNSNSKESGPVA